MSLQVDLLKKVERRYQGIVSMKVLALGSVSVLVSVTILVFSLAGISKMTLSANLDRARHEFGLLDPKAVAVRNGKAAIDANRKTLGDLKSWSQGDHLPIFSILRDVQREIPMQMALENLYIGLESELDAGTVYYTLRLSGRVQGELTAVDAKRRLNSNAELRRFCGETKLVSSQRESGENWIFMLEGRRLAGDAK